MSKELEALERIENGKYFVDFELDAKIGEDYEEEIAIIKTALKRLEELEKIEYKQNVINDFYPNTKEMIDDLLNLVSTKMCDFLKEGETYTKTRTLELLGTAIGYVKTFAYGSEFNETEKIGVNAKKLKALEIIKEKRVDTRILQECSNLEEYNEYISMNWNDKKEAEYHNELLTQEEYDLLKEALL